MAQRAEEELAAARARRAQLEQQQLELQQQLVAAANEEAEAATAQQEIAGAGQPATVPAVADTAARDALLAEQAEQMLSAALVSLLGRLPHGVRDSVGGCLSE